MGIKLNFPDIIRINPNGQLFLSEIEDDNIVNIDALDYQLSNLIIEGKVIYGGGNSYILKLCSPNPDELNDDDIPAEAIMKICRYPTGAVSEDDKRRIERFKVETKALYFALEKNSVNIIKIITDGTVTIKKQVYRNASINTFKNEYYFYLMEAAEYNLPIFLKTFELSIKDKLDLCSSILNGLSELHDQGYYHRDIKHDNILFVEGEWKIGDLGLVGSQNDDKKLDIKNEKIGPYGWLSPEVMNKVLTEEVLHINPAFDCKLDKQSDYFQIGKLIWYIFQENLPIGNLAYTDFRIKDEDLYGLILRLLQYSKDRRPIDINEINAILTPIIARYLLAS